MAGMDLIFLNACKNGQKGVVQAFIKKGGIDFNKRDAQGCTPLFYACIKGARDIVKLLLDGGADASLFVRLFNAHRRAWLYGAARAGKHGRRPAGGAFWR